MNYICDCMGNKDKDKNKISQGRGTFGHTEVYSDGTCKHCGHYAVQFKKLGYNRGKPSLTASLGKLFTLPTVEYNLVRNTRHRGDRTIQKYTQDSYERH